MSMVVKVGADNTGALTGLAQVESAVKRLGGVLAGTFIGAFTFERLVSEAEQLISELAKIKDVSRAFGIGAEEFQRFRFAIEQTGGNVESLGMALKNLSSARATGLSDSGSDAARSFSMLGISLQQLKESSPGDLFLLVRNRLSEIGNEADRSALAQKLLGRAFLSLAPSIAASTEEFKKLADAADVASQSSVDAAKHMEDAFKAAGASIMETGSKILEAWSPVILFFAGLTNLVTNTLKQMAFTNNPFGREGLLGPAVGSLVTAGPAAALKEAGDYFSRVASQAVNDFQKARVIMGGMTIGDNGEAITNRNVDVSGLKSDVQRLEEAEARKAIRDKEELIRAQEKYDSAVADSAAASMDANERIGQKNAEIVDLQTRLNGLQKESADWYNTGAELAKKQTELTRLKNDAMQDSVRLQEQEARAAEKLQDAKRKIEDFDAAMQGPQAELDLARSRASQAVGRANETGRLEDRLKAQEDVRAFQRMSEDVLQQAGVNSANARGISMDEVRKLGSLPTFSGLSDIARSTMPQAIIPADIAKDGTVDTIRAKVEDCVNRLDAIIRSAGTFSM
jgi:hypothetical protein